MPNHFNFKNYGAIDFDKALKVFDWDIENEDLEINFTNCHRANYQTLALLVPYLFKMKSKGNRIIFKHINEAGCASSMWKKLGAGQLFNILLNEQINFNSNVFKPLFAIRYSKDFQIALEKINTYTQNFNIEYERTLRYVLTEIFYNAIEHGKAFYDFKMQSFHLPAITQFSYYEKTNELHFIIIDLGIGIKKHLENNYPGFESDEAAILFSLKPNVSGTFNRTYNMYEQINNAGMGLFISSNIIRKLHSDMYIISNKGCVHISPSDITSKSLQSFWPGTFVLITIKLHRQLNDNFDQLLSSFRRFAQDEVVRNQKKELDSQFYLSIYNIFGSFAEDKERAIKYRDEKIMPAIESGKTIIIDFENVSSAPHSFINALIASPISRLGLLAYKKIKVVNKSKDIEGIVDYIFDEHTPSQ